MLAALRERDATGRGQEVRSALFENRVFLCSQHMQQFSMTHEPPPPMPSRVSAWSVYDVLTLAQGEQLFIGAVSDKQFTDLLDRAEYADNTLRVAVPPQLLEELAEISRTTRLPNCRRRSKPPACPTHRSFAPSSCSTTYQAEPFPTSVRCRATGLVYSASRVGATMSGFLIAFLLRDVGVVGVSAGITGSRLTVVVSIGVFGPKTDGSTLEELSL